jgi:FMN phosphatase YigB (HAD superfamily)
MIKAVLFDWGNTLMVDFKDEVGPMYLWSRLAPTPHAVSAVAAISRQYPCYLATNARDSTEEEVWLALDMVDLGRYLTGVFCYRSLQVAKPSQAYFECIRRRLAVEFAEMALIGDDWDADYRAAAQHGLHAILYDPAQTCTDTDVARVHDLRGVLPMLQAIDAAPRRLE